MQQRKAAPALANPGKKWQKTSYANLVRYIPSGTYYARLRVAGKLIRKSLKTTKLLKSAIVVGFCSLCCPDAVHSAITEETITAATRLIETRFAKDAIMPSSCGACESRSAGFF